MKTLFSVYGYGLGHATRCYAIMKELKKYEIAASDDAYEYFKKKGQNPLRINSFKIGNFMNSFSWIQTLFQNMDLPINMMADYNKMKQLVKKFKPDVIISDTEPVSVLTADALGVKNHFLSNIVPIMYEYDKLPPYVKNNNLASQQSVIKLYLNQVLKKSELIISPTITRYDAGYKVKFTDLIVRQEPTSLNSMTKIRKKHDLPKDFILVSFGGAEITKNYYNNILPLLREFPDQEFIVSTNHAVKQRVKIKNTTLYPFIEDYLSFLKCSKGVISLAGHSTISESLVYGKPILTIPIKEHIEQLINAAIIKDKGYGNSYFFKDKIKKDKLKKKIQEFMDNIKAHTQTVKKAGFKGDGATEIVKILNESKREFKY